MSVHTHSHLEHQQTDDTALRIRRDTLAEADTQADSGHSLPGTLCTPSPRELFTVHSHRGPLEKNVGAATLTHMVQQKRTQLTKPSYGGSTTETHARQHTHSETHYPAGPPTYLPHKGHPEQVTDKAGEKQTERHTCRRLTHHGRLPSLPGNDRIARPRPHPMHCNKTLDTKTAIPCQPSHPQHIVNPP